MVFFSAENQLDHVLSQYLPECTEYIHTHAQTQHTYTHNTHTHAHTHTHTHTHIHAHNTCSLFTFQCSKKYQRKFLQCSRFHHYFDSFTINKRSGENDLVFENVQSMQP